jgi:hypothetical protein
MRIKDRGVIFDGGAAAANERSCAFTSATRLSDGSMLVGFRLGTGRDAPDGRLRVMRSRDDGQSWETLHRGLTAMVDGIEGNFYSGYFTELAPDRLLGAFVWVDRSNPELSFVNSETAGILPMKALLAESADGGVTWGPYREVDLGPETGCSVTGPIFALPGDRLALPYESWKDYDDPEPGHHASRLAVSEDDGATWQGRVVVAESPDSRVFYWDQRFTVHPETGEFAAMFWTHDRDASSDIENHICWGSADGERWTVPVSAGWRGQHCQPVALGGDRMAAAYVHRHDPPSLRLVLSDDFGHSWNRDDELTFYSSEIGTEAGASGPRQFEDFWQDMMAWRFGHPRGLLLPDSDLFIAYYGGTARGSTMEWVRIGC